MKKVLKTILFLCFLCMTCCTITLKTTSKDINAAQKTTKAYKKYLGKWETVNYKMNVKVINKNYLKTVIKAKNGDTLTINQKMKVKRKNSPCHARIYKNIKEKEIKLLQHPSFWDAVFLSR